MAVCRGRSLEAWPLQGCVMTCAGMHVVSATSVVSLPLHDTGALQQATCAISDDGENPEHAINVCK